MAYDHREERTEFVKTKGLRFEVTMAGEGDDLALLLHGFPECSYSWRHQWPLLARLGYRVWAPNLRGYGKSDRPDGVAAYALDHLEQDVADLIDASGAKSVLLVGHDWGGAVAWNFAMYRVRPIARLVIMNVPHPARFLSGLRSPRQLRKSWYMGFFQIPRLPEALLTARDHAAIPRSFVRTAADPRRFPAEALEVFRRNAAEPGGLTAMLNWYRAMPRDAALARRRGSPVIDVPTLLLWGEQDAFLSKELSYGTDRYASDLTVRYLPDAAHWVQQEAPETVNAMLEAWLAGQPVPGAPAR